MIAFVAFLLSAGQAAPPPVVRTPSTPPPPIVTVHNDRENAPNLAVFRPGEARCGGAVQRAVHLEQPRPTAVPFPPGVPQSPVSIRFRLDSTGRPLGLTLVPPGPPGLDATDLLPALAVSRFAPGTERGDCEIVVDVEILPVSDAPPPVLHQYLVLGANRSPWAASAARAAFERTIPAASDCFRPSPNVRLRAYPAFETIPQAPGTTSYAALAFDIDAEGRPVNARVTDSSGNRELDRQSLEALSQSRFQPGARRGCTYPYWRRGDTNQNAPELPASAAFRQEDADCPEDRRLANLPPLQFPPGFERRNVEGWAIVRYDVAPWGATGNVRALAAEPAAPFGEWAANIVRQARQPESERGYRGCVARVRFVLPARREDAEDEGLHVIVH